MTAVSPLSPARPPARRRPSRRRRRGRGLALFVLAVAALAAGAYAGSRHEPVRPRHRDPLREARGRAATCGAMYAELSPAARREVTPAQLHQGLRAGGRHGDARAHPALGPARGERRGRLRRPRASRRRGVFGDRPGRLRITVAGEDDEAGVVWNRAMVFPGLRRGERLSRDVTMPPRASIQARDGTPIAEGADRTSPSPVAPEVRGSVGPIPPESADAYAALGYPPNAQVGLSGLERQFERRLAGTFGGTLRAGRRELATAEPERGGRGADVDRPRHRAGRGHRARRALRRHRRPAPAHGRGARAGRDRLLGAAAARARPSRSSRWRARWTPRSSSRRRASPCRPPTTLSGVELENANGESCGGSLAASFAHSCNTVFAPLGRQARRPPARRRGRALRLQRGERHHRRAAGQHPRGRRDRRRPRRRLVGDRPGPRDRHAAADGRGRRRDRQPRDARPADVPARRARPPHARRLGRHRTPDQGLHAARDPGRHRRRGGDPGREGGGQDRDRGAPQHRPGRHRHRPPTRPSRSSTTRRTPTRGSSPSPRPTGRRSRSRCCWSARAPAGRRPRRRRRSCSKRRSGRAPRRRGPAWPRAARAPVAGLAGRRAP